MSGFKPFRKLHTTDRELDRVQDAIKQTFDSFSTSPLLTARYIAPVTLAVGANNISHGLGRNYVDVVVCLPSAAASVSQGASPDRTKFINLVSSAATTAGLLVF